MTKGDNSGYKYIVLGAVFLALMVNASIDYASGVIHVALLEEYHVEEDVAVWLGSLFFCMCCLSGPIASSIINMSDCRTCVFLSGIVGLVGFSINVFITDINWLFLTYALIAGTGNALSHTGSLVALGYYFQDNISLASGVAVCGYSTGLFIHPRLCQYLIDQFTFRYAFLIIGAIAFHSSIAGLLMRPTTFERERRKTILSGRSQRAGIIVAFCGDCSGYSKIMTNKSFVFFLISAMGFGIGLANIYIFLPDYLYQNGITHQEASLSVSLSGISGIIARVLCGFAANDTKIGSGLLYASTNGLMGILCLLIPLFTSSAMASHSFGLLVGLNTGGTWALFNPITYEILGLELMATGTGSLMFFCGFGSLIGSPLAVMTYKAAGSYYVVYVFAGLTFLLCTLCAFLSTVFRVQQKHCVHFSLPYSEFSRNTLIDRRRTIGGNLKYRLCLKRRVPHDCSTSYCIISRNDCKVY